MFNLSPLYFPITANPAQATEYPPCEPLQPFIRCFWGFEASHNSTEESRLAAEESSPHTPKMETIIPDTCMDIIWRLDGSAGTTNTFFSGINDAPFEVPEAGERTSSCFGIRFHFWAVHYFADDHLRNVLNAHVDVEQYFGSFKSELASLLEQASSMKERIAVTEAFLFRLLERKGRTNDRMMNAIYMLVKQKGLITAEELVSSANVSSRQLERLFQEYIGVSPKKTADMVRFQNVWREMYQLSGRSKNIQDLIFEYRFSHQSHFINNFKKYAGRTPLDALTYAGR